MSIRPDYFPSKGGLNRYNVRRFVTPFLISVAIAFSGWSSCSLWGRWQKDKRFENCLRCERDKAELEYEGIPLKAEMLSKENNGYSLASIPDTMHSSGVSRKCKCWDNFAVPSIPGYHSGAPIVLLHSDKNRNSADRIIGISFDGRVGGQLWFSYWLITRQTFGEFRIVSGQATMPLPRGSESADLEIFAASLADQRPYEARISLTLGGVPSTISATISDENICFGKVEGRMKRPE
jgi:hypothetical protein